MGGGGGNNSSNQDLERGISRDFNNRVHISQEDSTRRDNSDEEEEDEGNVAEDTDAVVATLQRQSNVLETSFGTFFAFAP